MISAITEIEVARRHSRERYVCAIEEITLYARMFAAMAAELRLRINRRFQRLSKNR